MSTATSRTHATHPAHAAARRAGWTGPACCSCSGTPDLRQAWPSSVPSAPTVAPTRSLLGWLSGALAVRPVRFAVGISLFLGVLLGSDNGGAYAGKVPAGPRFTRSDARRKPSKLRRLAQITAALAAQAPAAAVPAPLPPTAPEVMARARATLHEASYTGWCGEVALTVEIRKTHAVGFVGLQKASWALGDTSVETDVKGERLHLDLVDGKLQGTFGGEVVTLEQVRS